MPDNHNQSQTGAQKNADHNDEVGTKILQTYRKQSWTNLPIEGVYLKVPGRFPGFRCPTSFLPNHKGSVETLERGYCEPNSGSQTGYSGGAAADLHQPSLLFKSVFHLT